MMPPHWFSCKMTSEKWLQKFYTLLTGNYPDLGSASDWLCCDGIFLQPIRSTTQIWEGHFINIEYLQSFLRCSFAEKPVVASQNVGWLFSQSNMCLLSIFLQMPSQSPIHCVLQPCISILFIVQNTCIYCRMLTGAQNTFVYRNMYHGILAVRENIQVLHLTPVCCAVQLFIVQ